LLFVVITTLAVTLCRADSGECTPPAIRLPSPLKHPVIACTADELQRLHAAWKSPGTPAQAVVAAMVRSADRALERPLEFPPRGGQHNQWYQCEKCQLGLRTRP
jgi:hypothetical protein